MTIETRDQASFVHPEVAAELGALAWASRQRTTHVAEDGRGLSARRRPVPRLPGRASGRGPVVVRFGGAQAGGRARLHGGAPRRRHRQPLAHADARRGALVRPLPRTQPQGQRCRAAGRAGAQDRQDPAQAALHRCRQAHGRRRPAGRGGARALDFGARCRCPGAALRLALHREGLLPRRTRHLLVLPRPRLQQKPDRRPLPLRSPGHSQHPVVDRPRPLRTSQRQHGERRLRRPYPPRALAPPRRSPRGPGSP